MFKFEVAKSPRQLYGAFDRLLGPESRRPSGGSSATPTSPRRHRLHQFGRLQHRSYPLAYRAVHGRRRRDHGRGLVPARPRAGRVREAGLFAIVDLHAAPGGQTGINHDDGPGYP